MHQHKPTTLQWRRNEQDGVLNHRRLDCLLNLLFRCRSKKTSKLCVTGLCDRWFHSQKASNAGSVSTWWRHNGKTPWWRHQIETFSALLTLCADNSPVPVNSPHKDQWRGVLMFSLICVWINGWVNSREAGDLRRHLAHYDVNVMPKRERCAYSLGCIIYSTRCPLDWCKIQTRVNFTLNFKQLGIFSKCYIIF